MIGQHVPLLAQLVWLQGERHGGGGPEGHGGPGERRAACVHALWSESSSPSGGPGLMRSVTQRPALRSKLLRGVSLASPGAPL